jgi:hypothetical protein
MTFALALVVLFAAAARAQEREPLPRVAADFHVVSPKFPNDNAIATALTVTTENLPGRGLGLAGGVHVYPARLGKVTLGLGGEIVVSRASKTLEPASENAQPGPTVDARFSALVPHVSLNFGSREGWSYVSAGIALTSLTIERDAAPVAEADGRGRAIHYGGGARWFAKDHLAFSFDVRFYRLPAQDAIVGRPAYPKARMIVLSAGISVK